MKKAHLLTASLLLFLACAPSEPLPTYDPVPEWELTTADEQAMEMNDLRGNVAIYDFIFTRCVASCPLMTSRMADLASRIRSPEVRFVSISVDPEWDTPSVLRDYREETTTDDRWIFLTGTRDDIREISVDGFKLAAEPPEQAVDSGPIVHSSKFVLVDRQGVIRGYYDSLSPEAMDTLLADARRLLKE